MSRLKTNTAKALFYAKKIIAQTVTDVVNLEDINYTVAEVQTLMDGITVGGHKIHDELIVINQINAWQFLFDAISNNNFAVSHDFCCKLHKIVANQEALAWGEFRSSLVSISGTQYTPPNSSRLNTLWNEIVSDVDKQLHSTKQLPAAAQLYQTAISLFAKMAKYQFFYDGNKRTARMMMSGLLLANGSPMINVPAKRKNEFHQIMINYYDDDKCFNEVHKFMLSCLDDYIINEFELDFVNKKH
jgi:Fic family protein